MHCSQAVQAGPETQAGHMGEKTRRVQGHLRLGWRTDEPVVQIQHDEHPWGKGEAELEHPELKTTPLKKLSVVWCYGNVKVGILQVY